jgi:hypothetical protein
VFQGFEESQDQILKRGAINATSKKKAFEIEKE